MSVKTILIFNVIIIQSSKFDLQINYAVLLKKIHQEQTTKQLYLRKKAL